MSAGQTASSSPFISTFFQSLGMWKKDRLVKERQNKWCSNRKKWWSRRKRSENEWFSTGWIFPIWPNRTKTMTDWAKNFFPFFDEMAAKIIAKDPPYQIMRSAPLWNLLTAHRSGQRVAKKCQKLEESLILYMPDRLKTIWPSKQIKGKKKRNSTTTQLVEQWQDCVEVFFLQLPISFFLEAINCPLRRY